MGFELTRWIWVWGWRQREGSSGGVLLFEEVRKIPLLRRDVKVCGFREEEEEEAVELGGKAAQPSVLVRMR